MPKNRKTQTQAQSDRKFRNLRREGEKKLRAMHTLSACERSKANRKLRRARAIEQFNDLLAQHKAGERVDPPSWPFKGLPPISYVTFYDGFVKRKGGENHYGPAKKVVLAVSVYASGKFPHFERTSVPFA